MSERRLMKGNEALAEAAVRAGCQAFFGYPITPQNEIPEYLSWRLPEVGGVFLQAESEVAAINMVYGAAGAGARVMTSSSSPGISLKQEGISYIAGAELPCVIVNVARGGPGLGGIQPAQSDYFQATRGGGHGDYRTLVLTPGSVQEMVDQTVWAFDLAEKYRNPVLILADGVLGQMMEAVELPPMRRERPIPPQWATTGKGEGSPRVINSLYLQTDSLVALNQRLIDKYALATCEARHALEEPGGDWLLVAYGTSARVCRSAQRILREAGIEATLFRPLTAYPFPAEALREAAAQVKGVLVVEMSAGQMVEDVRLSLEGQIPIRLLGVAGGIIPDPKQVVEAISSWEGEG